ncbi:MAG: hypothetical protein WC445_04710 [Patescibacteria group bacterium]
MQKTLKRKRIRCQRKKYESIPKDVKFTINISAVTCFEAKEFLDMLCQLETDLMIGFKMIPKPDGIIEVVGIPEKENDSENKES